MKRSGYPGLGNIGYWEALIMVPGLSHFKFGLERESFVVSRVFSSIVEGGWIFVAFG